MDPAGSLKASKQVALIALVASDKLLILMLSCGTSLVSSQTNQNMHVKTVSEYHRPELPKYHQYHPNHKHTKTITLDKGAVANKTRGTTVRISAATTERSDCQAAILDHADDCSVWNDYALGSSCCSNQHLGRYIYKAGSV